uniref:Uncharacterized protein n=1 Tax=Amphimedon queenslandica TaxID=400682 RepID=A0A1X7SUQ0_AMPQE
MKNREKLFFRRKWCKEATLDLKKVIILNHIISFVVDQEELVSLMLLKLFNLIL